MLKNKIKCIPINKTKGRIRIQIKIQHFFFFFPSHNRHHLHPSSSSHYFIIFLTPSFSLYLPFQLHPLNPLSQPTLTSPCYLSHPPPFAYTFITPFKTSSSIHSRIIPSRFPFSLHPLDIFPDSTNTSFHYLSHPLRFVYHFLTPIPTFSLRPPLHHPLSSPPFPSFLSRHTKNIFGHVNFAASASPNERNTKNRVRKKNDCKKTTGTELMNFAMLKEKNRKRKRERNV